VEVDPARAVAYVATIDNVAAVDVANATPQVLAQVPTPGTAVEVAALGDHLWVADWERVRMLDVSDPAAPVVLGDEPVVGSPALPRARTVAVAGASLLVGEWTGLHVHAIEPGAFAPDISLDTRALSFAAVQVGEADARVVVLRNVGTEPLEICAITPLLDGLTVDTSSATVQPQAALTFEASWTASSTDPVEGSIAIASDDPDQPVVHVPVRGNDPGIGVGDPMPAFFHVDHDGRSRAHTELEGKVAVLAYFATWCGACNEHFPDYDVVLWQGYRDQDFAIWGLGNETLAKILAFAGSTGATFPLLLGETTYQAYDDPPGSNYSLEVVVDRQGIVRAIGHEELTAQVLEPLVVELLAE
jgi:peroxiredoxin